jgi:hypothetical protein
MLLIKETIGARGVGARALTEARPAQRPPAAPLGEWLLSSGFRASCQAMRAAAQFCGMAAGDDARWAGGVSRERADLDLQALLLAGPLPLSEIAAAHRERK